MFNLQRLVFSVDDERLLAVVAVVKTKSAKIIKKTAKEAILCLTVRKNNIAIHKIKVEGDNSYSKDKCWLLDDLKMVDGVKDNPANKEFILVFEKPYKWIAHDVSEKNSFLFSLWKLGTKYLDSPPQFARITFPHLAGEGPTQVSQDVEKKESIGGAAQDVGEPEDNKELTMEEEADTEELLSTFDWGTNDTQNFIQRLEGELNALEAANIHALLESEEQVEALMEGLDKAIDALDRVDEWITSYDDALQKYTSDAGAASEMEENIVLQNANYRALHDEVARSIDQLDIPEWMVESLEHGDLARGSELEACLKAALTLNDKLHITLNPGVAALDIVQKKTASYTKLQSYFADRFMKHFTTLLSSPGLQRAVQKGSSSGTGMYDHDARHTLLLPLAPITLWLFDADAEAHLSRFSTLLKAYGTSVTALYSKEIKSIVDNLKAVMGQKGKGDVESLEKRIAFHQAWGGMMSDLFALIVKEEKYWLSFCKVDMEAITIAVGPAFDPIAFEKSLHVAAGDKDEEREDGPEDKTLSKEARLQQTNEKPALKAKPVVHFSPADSTVPIPEEGEDTAEGVEDGEKLARAALLKRSGEILTHIGDLMTSVFGSLESEFVALLEASEKVDSFYALSVLVHADRSLGSATTRGSPFLHRVHVALFQKAYRFFDSFFERRLKGVVDIKAPKKSGVLPCIDTTAQLLEQAEKILSDNVSLRPFFHKEYVALVEGLFQTIERVAVDFKHSDVFMFENFHRVYDRMSMLKIEVLRPFRARALELHREYLALYVREAMGRPLEALSVFFDGVQRLVDSGVAPPEVGFHMTFSKQNLRKNIEQYPGKEVKKGLEAIFKRVERHLCVEENLVVVVWHRIQDEFVKQYKHFEALIEKCYPKSNIKLLFDVEDLLAFFSNIAKASS